ncbi:MAG TPA: hypothetical protein VGF48_06120 [Thermoanaerobaculia bacterium]
MRSTNPNRTTPLWVPFDLAFAPTGQLSEKLFDVYALRDLREFGERSRMRAHSGPHAATARTCFGERPAEIPARVVTVAELASSSRTIFSGRIADRTMGFFEDAPAALLTVDVERQIKRSPEFRLSDGKLLLHYPDASFSVGDVDYCIQPATHAARPRVGDRVLVFAIQVPVDPSGRLVYTQASKHLVFETAAGELLVPDHLRQEVTSRGIKTLDQFLQHLVSCEEEKGKHRPAVK